MTVWIALALALVVTAITVLAGQGKIPNNGLVGIRTRNIQFSDVTWKEGHRAAVPYIVGMTVAVVVGAVVILIATQDSGPEITNMAGLALLCLNVVGVVAAAIRANAVAGRYLG